MLAEKFLLLLETFIGRVVDEKPPAVTATFPDPRHSVSSAATPSRRQSE
jgi:hypothetical protein